MPVSKSDWNRIPRKFVLEISEDDLVTLRKDLGDEIFGKTDAEFVQNLIKQATQVSDLKSIKVSEAM